MKKILLATTLTMSACFAGSASALVVNTTNDSTVLSNAILGSGITINSTSYSGGAYSSGTFTDGMSSGIGMESGIILTTGAAADAVGPNDSDSTSVDSGTGGLAILDALIPGYTTYNHTMLTIDFTSDSDSVYFNYVFASEEYNEWVGTQYNDVFGLFLDGINLAKVPGSGDTVSINTVNGGSNSAYYNNNDLDNGGPFFNIEYDGFTNVLTASLTGLSAGLHTLQLAIADAGDTDWDSAVFIQGGTLSDEPTPVPAPAPLALLGLGLMAMGLRRKTA